jgi:hypothetical protein
MTSSSRLVYTLAASHSGSTLLDLLLNNHPQIHSLGEVARLNIHSRSSLETCTCGHLIPECSFWQRVEARVRSVVDWSESRSPLRETEMMLLPGNASKLMELLQKLALLLPADSFARWMSRTLVPAHESALHHSLLWYDAIHRVAGVPILAESTKDIRRMRLLHLALGDRFRVIYLLRDGRAVAASEIRREGASMKRAATAWRRYHRRARWALRAIPARHVIRIRYEDLCTNPEGTLGRICGFFGVDLVPSMSVLRKANAHSISGNPMRFRREETTVEFDERWRESLTQADLRAFDRIAGPMNRRLGYTDSPGLGRQIQGSSQMSGFPNPNRPRLSGSRSSNLEAEG